MERNYDLREPGTLRWRGARGGGVEHKWVELHATADWPRKVPTRHKAEESESEGEKVKFRFSDGCPSSNSATARKASARA